MLEKETVTLFQWITSNTSISTFIRKIQKELFINPVMVTNTYFKVVGMSCNKDYDDEVWNYAKKYHCCSKESILSFRNDDASKQLFFQDKPFLYTTNLGKNIPRILGRIQQNGIVYGYIIIFEVEQKITDLDVHKTGLVCKALSIIMSNMNNMESISNSRREYFYRKLLKMNAKNKLELENEIMQFQWDFKSYFKVMSITSPKYKSHYIYLCNEINKSTEDITSFIYEEQILIILNFQDTINIDSILKHFHSYQASIGISRTFYDLSQLNIYFKQAIRARELGHILHPEFNIYPFSQYEYYDMIMHYPKEEWQSLICQEYQSLKIYDKTNNTELLPTCITYFLTGLKISQAANQLHIHRNTLTYRISIIEEIIQTHINNIETLDLIYHSSLIDKLIQVEHK